MLISKLLCFLPIAASIIVPFASAWEQSKEYRVDPWGIPNWEGYPRLDGAKPGDKVSFYWSDSGDYNVYLYPTESCVDESGKEWIGSTSGSSYTIKKWDEGKSLHFACDTDDYCERGMSIVINVSAGPGPAPTGSSWGAVPTPWPTVWVPPTKPPTKAPTPWPTNADTPWPTEWVPPTEPPTKSPTSWPTYAYADTVPPSRSPTKSPTVQPIYSETVKPTSNLNENESVVNVEPKEILIDSWDIPADTQPFSPIEANVGDTIKWRINPGHDVWYHPSLTCDQAGSTFVGDTAEEVSYTFRPEDGSVEGTQHLFACQVGSHCDLGMQLTVTVFAQQINESDNQELSTATTQNLDWLVPGDLQPFAPVNMNVGDSITFLMGGGHNVYIHPSGSCDQTDRVFVGDETVTYTFKPDDGSPEGKVMFFACDVGSHCDLGMQIAVTVFSEVVPSSGSSSSENPPSSPSIVEADRISGREFFFEWEMPEDNQAFDPIEVVVGDTIIFSWENENQSVFIHPSLTCDKTLSVFVGLNSPTAYTFQPSDGSPEGKEHLFVSDVGANCELGMQLLVKVYSASDITSDGTNGLNPLTSTSPTSGALSLASILTWASVAGITIVSVLMI
ncbi:hypothetical protein IV203_003722 [Nitzschia inconspicua]|uniref:Phytocyanin domain-containing protein n=1 Tax=Nitzschia inconspicua TaxID=303405 RepID=A0A9K3L415_9STRA|nr:hypothetical protein IV203_003722 [Nitzschia inconspicua]